MTLEEWHRLPAWVKSTLAQQGRVDLDAIQEIDYDLNADPVTISVRYVPVAVTIEVTFAVAPEGG